jgi:hypothetical protein
MSVEAFRDPIAAWPWPGGDTWDFVAGGLVLRGHDLGVGLRTALLPAIVALGDASGLLGLAPLFGIVAACATPVLLMRETARQAGAFGATAAVLALLFCQTWLRHGLEWMADVPAAAMLALAVAALAPATGSPRWICAGVLASVATLTSQIGLLVVPLMVAAALILRPRGAEAGRAALGMALPLVSMAAWLAVRPVPQLSSTGDCSARTARG